MFSFKQVHTYKVARCSQEKRLPIELVRIYVNPAVNQDISTNLAILSCVYQFPDRTSSLNPSNSHMFLVISLKCRFKNHQNRSQKIHMFLVQRFNDHFCWLNPPFLLLSGSFSIPMHRLRRPERTSLRVGRGVAMVRMVDISYILRFLSYSIV